MSDKSQDSGKLWTVRMVLQWTQQRFSERGIPSSRLDAELLLAHALSRSRISLYTGFEQPLTMEELARFKALIRRRMEGEPVAYLIGRKDFWTLTLSVTPAVLIPRPETETLVEVALMLLPGPALPEEASEAGADPAPPTAAAPESAGPAGQAAAVAGEGELTVHYDGDGDAAAPAEEASGAAAAGAVASSAPAEAPARGAEPALRIADIGTGSGAVALSLKKERPAAALFAVDVSPAALEVARANGAALELAVSWLQGDLTEPLREHAPFELIVSNPPYIASGDIAGLAPEVRSEPQLALDGGPDGLRVIRRLVLEALPLLSPGGALAMEVGAGQAVAVAAALRAGGYVSVAIEDDLARIPRVVSGRRP